MYLLVRLFYIKKDKVNYEYFCKNSNPQKSELFR